MKPGHRQLAAAPLGQSNRSRKGAAQLKPAANDVEAPIVLVANRSRKGAAQLKLSGDGGVVPGAEG